MHYLQSKYQSPSNPPSFILFKNQINAITRSQSMCRWHVQGNLKLAIILCNMFHAKVLTTIAVVEYEVVWH